MPEVITREMVIKEDAIKAPLDFAKNVDVSVESVDNLIKSLMKLNGTIASADSTTKLSKATVELTDAQKELEKIQNQITTAQAKNNDAYIAQKKVLDDVKQSTKDKTALGDKDAKSVEAQTAAIKQLGAALNINRKAYSDLKGEQERNSAQGLQLKKIIDEQDKSYKELKASIGDNKETVGAYREELEGLLVVQEGADIGIQGLITTVRTLGKAFLALLANPVFLAFAALAVTIGAVKSSVETFFETTEEGERIGDRVKATYDALFFTLRKGWSDVGKGSVGFFESVGEIGFQFLHIEEIAKRFFPSLVKYFEDAKKKADELESIAHEINEKLVKDIVDKAKSELDADILILNSKDKLNFADETRLKFAKEAFAIRVAQSAKEKELAEEQLEVVYKQIALEKGTSDERVKLAIKEESVQKQVQLTLDQKRRIAEATAKVYTVQNDILSQNKRLISEISTIEIEIDKRETEAIRKRYETQSNLLLAEYEAQIKSNDNVIKDVQSTQDEITAAIVNNAYLREATLAETNQKELDAARHAAEDRVKATGIYNAEEIAEIIKKDQVLLNEQKSLNTKYTQALKDEDKKLEVDLNTNVFTRLQKDYNKLTSEIKTKGNNLVTDLERAFIAGDKNFGEFDISSVQAYETTKKRIVSETDKEVLAEQSDFFKKQINLLKISNGEKEKLLEGISKVELDIESKKESLILAKETTKRNLLISLENQSFQTAQSIIQDSTLIETTAIDTKIKKLQEAAQVETTLAGDNQRAKDKIIADEAKKEKQLNDEKNKIIRRNAIYAKAIALAQAIINTDQAATKIAAEGLPELVPLVLAAGALQIAAIAATPIPQYFKGTKSAEGGPSIVGELGTEMMVTPSGKLEFTPSSATVMNIQKGTEIIPHEETMKILAMSAMGRHENVPRETYSDRELLKKVDILNASIKGIRQPDLLRQGLQIYHAKKEHDTFTKYIRGMNLGKWV